MMKDKEEIKGGNVMKDKGKWESRREVRKQSMKERQTEEEEEGRKRRKRKENINKSLPQKAMRENVLIDHSEESKLNNTTVELYFPAVTN